MTYLYISKRHEQMFLDYIKYCFKSKKYDGLVSYWVWYKAMRKGFKEGLMKECKPTELSLHKEKGVMV